jgi:epoxyqueuosine reductase
MAVKALPVLPDPLPLSSEVPPSPEAGDGLGAEVPPLADSALTHLAASVKSHALRLGFDAAAITDTELNPHEAGYDAWLAEGYHGTMAWLANNRHLRFNLDALVPGTVRVISVRMGYLPDRTSWVSVLKNSQKAYVARYALGRDYHKVIRTKLAKLATLLSEEALALGLSPPHQRAFVDSAPVLERPLAQKAGLGWIGKHTLLIHPQAGSWFFLGELFTSLPLPLDTERVAAENRCGDCTACLKVCPTDAFVAPYVMDARRCISYLTIENAGPIPEAFREPMGNRIYGCDDCQAICPWNKYAKLATETAFTPRNALDGPDLLSLWAWDEVQFLAQTEGSPIRRIGFERWRRNLAVALGNAPPSLAIIEALQSQLGKVSPLVDEHIVWALDRQHHPKRPRQRKIKRLPD